MTTHRSLNKLEFKAHMSIHNKTAVPEGETHDSNYTRDRFGRNHRLAEADGSPRLRRHKSKKALAILLPLAASLFSCAASAARNTDVQVESESFDERVINHKVNLPEENFAFFREGDTSLELNDDGDPTMNVRY